MRDHPLTSSSTPHPRTLSTTSSRPQCVTRCHGGTHRPSEAHTPERSRVGRQSCGGRLPNHRPKRSTTTNKPLRCRSARMAVQARLHARQRRRPRYHRHGPSECKARPPPKHQHPPRQQPRQPRMQHHHAPVATTTRRPPISISTKGWGNFGLEHLPPPERKREREREREDDGGSKRTRAAGLNECTSYLI